MPDQFTLLLEWRRNEAAGRGLAKLPPDYYSATSTYLRELRRSYESDLRENPSGRKGEISRQTYQRASQVARDILEGRVQKILSLAFQASIGGAHELPNALPEERSMFDELLGTLLEHRRTAAPYLESVSAPTAPAVPAASAAASPPPPSPAPRPRPASAPARPGGAAGPATYVRILEDGHTVEVGADTIDLRADDIVSLPPATAKLLIDTKVAEPIRASPPPSS
jgi:DNA replication initiation complex subunit (GINS family)